MRLTEKEAIEKSVELWRFLAKTGEEKEGWEGWEKYGEDIDGIMDGCFLCEYGAQESGSESLVGTRSRCTVCPYYQKYGYMCVSSESPYWNWDDSSTKKDRKEYAKQFLEQLQELTSKKVTIEIEINEDDAETLQAFLKNMIEQLEEL